MVYVDPKDYKTFILDYRDRHALGWDHLYKFYGEGSKNAYEHWNRRIKAILGQQESSPAVEERGTDDTLLSDSSKATVRSKLQAANSKRQMEALAREQITYEDLLTSVKEIFSNSPLPKVSYSEFRDAIKGSSDKRLITPVLLISDIHAGALYRPEEGLSNFTPTLLNERIYRLGSEVERITNTLKVNYEIDKLIICWAGDYIDGRTIYPGQHDDTVSLVTQFRDGISALTHNLLLKISPLYKEIIMLRIDGNHGKIGDNSVRVPKALDSLDTLFMDMLELRCADIQNIIWDDMSESEFKVFMVHGWNFLLHHGHRNKGLTHTPTTGARNRKRDMESMFHTKIDVSLSGHFHSPGIAMDGYSYNITNGSIPGGSPYGESLGLFNPPVQVLLTVSEECPVVGFYPILLSNRDECFTVGLVIP